MKEAGIENVLALRGDRPKDFEGEPFTDFHYASELVEHIKARRFFLRRGACYPEGHVDAHNKKKEDITYLKKKVDAGCDYLTTQMFLTTTSIIISSTGSGKKDHGTDHTGNHADHKSVR